MRRRRAALGILICLMLLPALVPLFGNSLRIGFSIHDPDSRGTRLGEELYDRINAAMEVFSIAREHKSAFRARISDDLELDRLVKIGKSIVERGGLVPMEQSEKRIEKDLSPDRNEVISLELDQSISDRMLSGDRNISGYVFGLNKLDLLLLCSIEPFDEFLRVRVTSSLYPGTTPHVLFDRISLPAQLATLLDHAFLAIITFLHGQPLGLVSITSPVPGLRVSVDGVPGTLPGNTLLLAPGQRQIEFDAPAYAPSIKTILVEPDTVSTIEGPRQSVSGKPLLITSATIGAAVSIAGKLAGTLPITWDSQAVPYVIQGVAKDLRPLTLQVSREQNRIELGFDVPWMNEDIQVARSQRQLYGSLGKTLLFIASAIVLESVGASVSPGGPGIASFQPFILASAGAAGVFAVDTALRLFAYYQKTKYSSL